jgi:hypothetical protein
MFGPDRDNQLTKVVWNADRDGHPNREDLSYYIDCWNYNGGNEVADHENWHEGWIDDVVGNSRQEGLGYTRIAQWLKRKVSRAHQVSYPQGVATLWTLLFSLVWRMNNPPGIDPIHWNPSIYLYSAR